MPSAQGHITVRRRAKDGTDGSDAVRYWVIPSATQIKRAYDGTMYPATITCEKRKQTGNAAPVITTEGTLYYQVGYEDGSITGKSVYGSTGVKATKAMVWIRFILEISQVEVASETVSIVCNGEDGEDALTIVVTPENISFNYDTTVTKQKVRVDVFKGGKKLKYSDEYLCSTLDGTNRVIVTGLSWNFEIEDTGSFFYTFRYTKGNDVNIDVPFTITVDNVKYDKVIHFTTVRNGSPGLQGCIYRRSKHVNGFTYHNDSALTSEGIRYIDLVYIMKDSTMFASHALWFRCKKTHTSNANNAPQKSNNGTDAWLEYWEPMNTLEPLYTPFLLADDAVITLMQSNQILIANDEGVITAGMSGSLAGSKIRIWAGSNTPDSAPFRVDVLGKLFSSDADIKGKITATSGTIAGFNISGNSLTNGPDFSNDACIIFRNDTHKTFAGIGGNVLPASTALRAVARFENEDGNNFWGIGRNIAMLLSAKNGDINHAFLGSGNGNLDGWIGGYKYSKFTLNTSNTIYNGYMKIAENNKWIIYATGSSSGITLPTLSEVRNALGIGSSTPFCIEFTVVADLHSQNNFNVYGRCQKKVTVNGVEKTPYYTGEYPTMTHWNNGRYDSLEMGAGDSAVFLLIYDPNKSGVLDTSYTLMYTARIINRQS